jgi:hypothetical protein
MASRAPGLCQAASIHLKDRPSIGQRWTREELKA